MTRKSRTGLLSAVTIWSLIVTPAALFIGGRGAVLGLVSVLTGLASLVMALTIPAGWDFGSRTASFKERLTAAPLFTAAALLFAGPFVLPWALHEAVGHPAKARIARVTEGGSYRLADPGTERNLGWLLFEPPEGTPPGAVIEVSVVRGGWAPPMSPEHLADGGADPYVNTLTVLTAVHVLACAAALVLWPKEYEW